MSQQNVELVRRLYEAWQRDGLGVVPELMDPDIEWVNPPNAIEPGTRRGYDGFAAAAESFAGVYRESRVTDASFHDAGDRIAVSATMSSHGGGSEFPIVTQRGYVFELRDGRVTRFSWFTDPLQAIEAVGLSADSGDTGRAMSQKSTIPGLIELTRRGYEAVARGDMDTAMSCFAPKAVYVTERFGRFEGNVAIRGYFEDWYGAFGGLVVTLEEIRDLGNGVVFTAQVIEGRHAGSSADVSLRNGAVHIFVDGLIVQSRSYVDIDEARSAAERLAEERG